MFVVKTLRTFFYFIAFLVIVQLKGINATQLSSTNSLYFDPFSEFKGTKVDRIIIPPQIDELELENLRVKIRERVKKIRESGGNETRVLQDPILAELATKFMEIKKTELEIIMRFGKLTGRQAIFVHKKKGKYFLNSGPTPDTLNEYTWDTCLKYYLSSELTSWICNKLTAKLLFRDIIGAKYVARLYGAFEHVKEIFAPEFWDRLPQWFVVKAVTGSYGEGVRVVNKEDPKTLAALHALEDLQRSRLTKTTFLVEEFFPPLREGRTLTDYKFVCFNGEVIWLIAGDAPYSSDQIKPFDKWQAIYTADWTLIGASYCNNPRGTIDKPEQLDEMVAIARKLSKGLPLVRVDMYLTKDEHGKVVIKIGEITRRSARARATIDPASYDLVAGSLCRRYSREEFDRFLVRDMLFIDAVSRIWRAHADPFHDLMMPGFSVNPHLISWDSRKDSTIARRKVLDPELYRSLLEDLMSRLQDSRDGLCVPLLNERDLPPFADLSSRFTMLVKGTCH
ncbi:MAG: hypothetical protein LBJ77_01445 [Holosporales bacterium]|jgi:hypothetical protein|nr:hypothetical protein [Holosporales bacterium]